MNFSFASHILACCIIVLGFGCSQNTQRSNITPGMAKTTIEPGSTDQARIIEVFGPPNIITRKRGNEMWVYDKVSSKRTASFIGAGGFGGGFGNSGVGAGGLSAGVGSSERSETTVMMIIYFDEKDVVEDYQISQTKF